MEKERRKAELEGEIFNYVNECNIHYVLTSKKILELSTDLTNFVVEAIDKYIKGQIEHGGDLENTDLDKEIRQEIIDLFHYNCARKRKDDQSK